MDALFNATIHTGDAVLDGAAVLISGDRIAGVVESGAVPPDSRRHDLGGGVLAPGFIDLQVNGGGGVLFNDRPDHDALCQIAAAHRRFGTTGFLPTIITDRRAVRAAAVAAVRDALDGGVPGVLGLHLEGPHISAGRAGVHDVRHIAAPEPEDIALMTALGPGRTLVTLAPETVPAETIRALAAAGVRVAAGHTAASWEEMRAGFAAGIAAVTHLYNAMSPLTGREPGAVGAALAEDGCRCGIIVDGHHVHDANVRLAWKAKPAGGLFLVTDAMPPVGPPVGAPPGDFTLYGAVIRVSEGRCVDAEGRLAGSALDMATAVRNCVRRVGIPLDEALRMAAAYPARVMGWENERGRIAPGLAADLVHLDAELRPRATWIAGKMRIC